MARKHRPAGIRPSIAGHRENEGGNGVAKRPENAASDNGEGEAARAPRRVVEGENWAQLMGVLRVAFAGMEGRINPPSSLLRMQVSDLAEIAVRDEIWVIGDPVVATVTLSERSGTLYVGKLAVAAAHQGQGLARRLIALAEARAHTRGLPSLMLETRVELVENHALFRHLGFIETARRAHPGFDHPTTVEFRKPVSKAAQV